MKDEDVVACGNFHLVVIRSLAKGDSLRFSPPPPLFSLFSVRRKLLLIIKTASAGMTEEEDGDERDEKR